MTVPAMQGRLAAIRRFAAGLQTRRLPASGQRRLPIYGQRRSLQTRRAAPHRMLELVLVRHGESEGNIAYRRSVQGDTSLYSGKFLTRHSSLWRLTDTGRAQAAEAGAWLEKHAAPTFDAFYTSEYLRAMETAGLLRLDGASWKTECNLRERDWGAWDLTPPSRRFEPEDARRKRHGLYFAPSGGESLAQVLLRVDSMLEFLHRHMVDRRVLMVCHGEIMWAFRLRFERLNQIT
ncbi:histidine phosphatase superfamily [Pelagophyceae sp. CCMP2097]|nr:histidine phosphatase superfamily [Pelagophyceae sp. CCMP2097]